MPQPTNGSPGHPGGPPRPVPTRGNRATLLLGISAGLVLLMLTVSLSVAIYRSGRSTASLPIARTAAPTPATSKSQAAPPTPAAPLPTDLPPTTAPASPTAPPSSTASTSPPAPATPRGPDRSLAGNALYGLDLDGRKVSCDLKVRTPRPPLKDADLAPYLREVVDCLVETFRKPLADEGITLSTPRVKTYAKTVKTPCGKYGQDKAPAFYCSATQTIYWASTSDNGREAYTTARLGYVALVAHEFGHHLQASSGMLSEYAGDFYATKKKNDHYLLSRRLELQAQCFEGVFLNQTAKAVKLDGSDRSELRRWHGYTGDEDPPKDRLPDHGSSKAQFRWLERGVDSGDFARCNTWTATKKTVK